MMHLTTSLAALLAPSLTNRSHQELVRYELPIIEEPGKPPVAEGYEKLAYAHRHTDRRTEFSRPRVISPVTPEHLAQIRAEWDAKVAAAPRRTRDCRIGFIVLPRKNAEIVAEWKKLARDPYYVNWPGRAEYEHAKQLDTVVPYGRDSIEWGNGGSR